MTFYIKKLFKGKNNCDRKYSPANETELYRLDTSEVKTFSYYEESYCREFAAKKCYLQIFRSRLLENVSRFSIDSFETYGDGVCVGAYRDVSGDVTVRSYRELWSKSAYVP